MELLFKKRRDRLSIFKQNRKKVVNNTINRKEILDEVIYQCPQCQTVQTLSELTRNKYICYQCQHHWPISGSERIRQLSDNQSFKAFDSRFTTTKYLDFPGYRQKLEKAKQTTGLNEAVITGVCTINKIKVVIAAMDSRFMMASMGHVVGEKITRAVEYATKRRLPLIICCASGGARMQEGIISLMQMAKTSAAIEQFNRSGGLYISILTHPTTGGVSASFAMLADIILAEPKALIGFAGKRVIQQTVSEVLPDNFQQAEFLLEHGFIDQIVLRTKLFDVVSDLLLLHHKRGKK